MSLFIGALIVVGSQALGQSYSSFILNSLGEGRSPGFKFFGAVVPALAGLALGYYLTRGLKAASEVAVRGLLIVGTFCLTQFALVYAVAVEDTSGELDAAVTPNVAFVVGLALVMALNLGVKSRSPDGGSELKKSMATALRDRATGRSSKKAPIIPSVAPRSEFHQD